ncbi:MAG: L-threonylcarbamoyladenylate synthase [Pseudobdellovibrionaceae bacterium]
MSLVTPTDEALARAAAVLLNGGLVAFPTETVYGLGADATNGKAVARIYEAKGRPSFNPLIVHVASIAAVEAFADMSERAYALAQSFWPGPLTLILPLKANSPISELCTAGLPTVAVRMPSHKVALSLLKAVNVPIAAPSANASGRLSPTEAAHVLDSLGDKVDMVLAGGRAEKGLESTICDVSGETPVILRHGVITKEDLEAVLEEEVVFAENESDDPQSPKAPGMLLKHYAPSKPLRLNAVDVEEGEALLGFGSLKFMGVRSGGAAATTIPREHIRNLSETGDLYEAAANLFAALHALDREDVTRIAVMNIPDQGVGIAINDRLKRAAHK